MVNLSSCRTLPIIWVVLIGTAFSGCSNGPADPADVEEIQLVLSVPPNKVVAPQAEEQVQVGLFFTIPGTAEAPTTEETTAAAQRLLGEAGEILGQCGLGLSLEVLQVIRVPGHLLEVQGNHRGSWGGHPPDTVQHADRFMYDQDERLTAEARELFDWGKQHTSPNAIAAFTVGGIEYYIGDERTGAGGLAFPPVVYHHADDYPLRNSVLLRRTPGSLADVAGFVLAHEVGHMLLNTGQHAGEAGTLMVGGTRLTPAQCDLMRANLAGLYGDEAVPDPGRP